MRDAAVASRSKQSWRHSTVSSSNQRVDTFKLACPDARYGDGQAERTFDQAGQQVPAGIGYVRNGHPNFALQRRRVKKSR
jgi:hypothetical protein